MTQYWHARWDHDTNLHIYNSDCLIDIDTSLSFNNSHRHHGVPKDRKGCHRLRPIDTLGKDRSPKLNNFNPQDAILLWQCSERCVWQSPHLLHLEMLRDCLARWLAGVTTRSDWSINTIGKTHCRLAPRDELLHIPCLGMTVWGVD